MNISGFKPWIIFKSFLSVKIATLSQNQRNIFKSLFDILLYHKAKQKCNRMVLFRYCKVSLQTVLQLEDTKFVGHGEA